MEEEEDSERERSGGNCKTCQPHQLSTLHYIVHYQPYTGLTSHYITLHRITRKYLNQYRTKLNRLKLRCNSPVQSSTDLITLLLGLSQ